MSFELEYTVNSYICYCRWRVVCSSFYVYLNYDSQHNNIIDLCYRI